MAQPNPSSVRVLVRPPHPTTSIAPSLSSSISSVTSAATSSTSTSLPSPPSSSPPPEGVVVVGFVGSRSSIESTHLINRILDANVFGSGNLDKDLFASRLKSSRRGEEWFRHRRISYHHEKEKGVVFLQFSSSLSQLSLPSASRIVEGEYASASALEELEADDLRGMLFMFSVCHVIIFLHEGLRFDTHILKRFRILQNSKHALSPFIRSKVAPTLTNTPLNSHPTAARITSIPSLSRRGVTSRHGSSISLMSGSGSNSSVLPGQCTPVILFVFIGDLLDESNHSTISEESVDVPSVAQLSSNAGGLPKLTSSSKGSGPVVVLARPASKTEGGFKKKLQSSLETQLRFLIKRCRTLVGTEHSNHGSRNATSLSTLPLFLFDSSKVVAMLDRSLIRRGESLDIITDLIEDAFNSKSTLDLISLEDHCQNANNDDIQAIKDFLYRQVDTIRGRGGLHSNASSGTVAGVGIVAAAAAAAAASAAAGKTLTSPDLPNLQHWLSLSNLILDSLISVDDIFLDEEGKLKKLSLEKGANETKENEISVEDRKAISAAVSCLESSKGLNFKFSISWCQRALPAAKNVYLDELPPFYPTALHKTHLERALRAFSSMVKGPATLTYSRKLEQECTEIWESGRQLCDTVSLTGKPCMHQRHDDQKQHSSGYVFLHACACGRSRRLRDDPFDFESANINFSCFANCEDLLPYLILPRDILVGSLPQNSWRLMRIAGARYYKPSKGLLQNGFSSTEKYLLKWEISLDKQKEVNSLPLSMADKSSSTDVMPESKFSFISDEEAKKNDADRLQQEPKSGRSENMVKKLEMGPLNNSSISFGKGLPSFPVKKPFSEVVAGTSGGNPFPSLQHKKPPKASADTCLGKAAASEQFINQVSVVGSREGPQKTEHRGTQGNVLGSATNEQIDENPVLQIGSNIVSVNYGGEKIFRDDCSKQVNIFVGFEHECAYGHRFLLSLDHLQDLESKFSVNELHSSGDGSETKTETRNGLRKKDPENSMATVTFVNNIKRTNRSAERSDKSNGRHGSITLLSRSENARSEPANGHPLPAGYQQKFDRNISCVKLDDGASAFSLLNRKLPVYMNCPYCKSLSSKDKMKISDTVSQLQRIFLVTPKFPTVLGTCPVVQFDDACLPPSVPNREQQTRFSFGCQVFLPPESFLTLKLPFVYGVRMDNGCLQPLNPLVQKPELTAWLVEGTALQIISLGHEDDEMMR
ncbi:uncharacterized protein LOC122006474 [Zingiber officinale]|uniref:uncharacterized protein LOC122006474 n=1 Tax=Zingiber officinale TaxID=94328 RepID=UPI001C4B8A2D|nr:uncharacterized protein LOC122006474 [Zingiber officinale]XP_042417926.1 uncharacterized protein LOC122006474 [Zingiber officinale]